MTFDLLCPGCRKIQSIDAMDAGRVVPCSCGAMLRVPKLPGDTQGKRSVGHRIVYFFGWGLAGAALTFFPAFVFLGRALASSLGFSLFCGCLALGFLIGSFGGESAITRLGRIVRDIFPHR